MFHQLSQLLKQEQSQLQHHQEQQSQQLQQQQQKRQDTDFGKESSAIVLPATSIVEPAEGFLVRSKRNSQRQRILLNVHPQRDFEDNSHEIQRDIQFDEQKQTNLFRNQEAEKHETFLNSDSSKRSNLQMASIQDMQESTNRDLLFKQEQLQQQEPEKKVAPPLFSPTKGIKGGLAQFLIRTQQSTDAAQEQQILEVPSPIKGYMSSKSIYQTNGQRLWTIVRRDIYYPIKFHGKVETGLVKKRKKKFKGSQQQQEFSQNACLFIHPHGAFKQAWDILTGLAHLYFPIMMPMRICFGIKNDGYYLLDIALETVFLFDMFFSSITGQVVGGELIRDRNILFKKYLKSTFAIDLLMLIPYQFFIVSLGYFKIFRLARYWDRFQFFLHKTVYFIFKGGSSHKFAVLFYYLFKVSTLILLCVHVLACLWIQAGMEPDYGVTDDLPYEFRQEGWVNQYHELDPATPNIGSISEDIYIRAYYYVTTTIATVGYGDFSSHTVMESLFTMFCEFFGIAIFGYISGGLVGAVKMSLLVGTLKRNKSKSEFENWLYQREKNKGDPLDKGVQKHLRAINGFNTQYNFSDFFHETEFFHYMPKEQKRRVFNLLFTDIASFFGAFFRNITELSMIQDIFAFMHPLTFLPGAEIIRSQTYSKGIYFIVSGKVYICDKTKKQVNRLYENPHFEAQESPGLTSKDEQKHHFHKLKSSSFFGEFCLLEKSSPISFTAGGPEPLLTLFITKTKLIEICMKYKETFSWLKQFAYYRLKYFLMEKNDFIRRKTIHFNHNTKDHLTGVHVYQEPEMTVWEQPQNEESDGDDHSIDLDRDVPFDTPNLEPVKTIQDSEQLPQDQILDDDRLFTEDPILEMNNESAVQNASAYSLSSDRDVLGQIAMHIIPTHNNSTKQKGFLSEIPTTSSSAKIIQNNNNEKNNSNVGNMIRLYQLSPGKKGRNAAADVRPSNYQHKQNKSDLEFFMQKGPDFFFAESMRNHQRQKSSLAESRSQTIEQSECTSHQLTLPGGVLEIQSSDTNKTKQSISSPSDLNSPPTLVITRSFKKQPETSSNHKRENSSTFPSGDLEEFTEKSNGMIPPVFRSNLDSHLLFNSDKHHRSADKTFSTNTCVICSKTSCSHCMSSPVQVLPQTDAIQLMNESGDRDGGGEGSIANKLNRKLNFTQTISKEWQGDTANRIINENNNNSNDGVRKQQQQPLLESQARESGLQLVDSSAPMFSVQESEYSKTYQINKESNMIEFSSDSETNQQEEEEEGDTSNKNKNNRSSISANPFGLFVGAEHNESLRLGDVNQMSASQSQSSEYFDSDEEQKMNDKLQVQQLTGAAERRKSVFTLHEITRAERKIRNAFRTLMNTNLQDEVIQNEQDAKHQLQLCEEMDVLPTLKSESTSMLSSLHVRKHKVMKKILQKKIDLLVSQSSERQSGQQQSSPSNSNSERSSFSNIRSLDSSIVKSNSMNSLPSKFRLRSSTLTKSIKLNANNNFSKSSDKEDQQNEENSLSRFHQRPSRAGYLIESLDLGGKRVVSNSADISKDLIVGEEEYEDVEESAVHNGRQIAFNLKENVESIAGVPIRRKKEVAFNDVVMYKDSAKQQQQQQQLQLQQQQESLSEVSEEEEDSIELQMENMKKSRFPNFELMLIIDKMIMKHEEEYRHDIAANDADDYQCYDEILNNEQRDESDYVQDEYDIKDGRFIASTLDQSFDIPIEVLQPNFEVQDLFALPSYLEINAICIRMDAIVAQVYDECVGCIEKIQELDARKIKQKQNGESDGQIMKGEGEEKVHANMVTSAGESVEQLSPQDHQLQQVPSKNLTKTLGFARKIVQNHLISKTLLKSTAEIPEASNQAENGANKMNNDIVTLSRLPLECVNGRVNLGLNIEFSLNKILDHHDHDDPDQVEYNFFTELNRKNQIHRDKVVAAAAAGVQATAGGVGQLAQGRQYQHALNNGVGGTSTTATTTNKNQYLMKQSSSPTQPTEQNQVQVPQRSITGLKSPRISEKQRIKNEFRKIFGILRHGASQDIGQISEMSDSIMTSHNRSR